MRATYEAIPVVQELIPAMSETIARVSVSSEFLAAQLDSQDREGTAARDGLIFDEYCELASTGATR